MLKKHNKIKSILMPIIMLILLAILIFSISSCNKKTYNDFYIPLQEAVNKGEEKITLSKPSSEKIGLKVTNRLVYGTPSNFHVERAYIASGQSDLERGRIYYSSRYKLEDYQKNLDRFNKKIEEITSQINPGYKTIEIIQWISEYMCLNYEYDYSYSNYNALAMLDDSKGTCAAYALLFKAFMDKLNIPCEVILGKADSGYGPVYNLSDHSWNIVKIGLFWYHIDVTWMDEGNKINYDYYLKSSLNFEKVYHHQFNQIFNNNHLLWFNKETPEKQIYIK